MINFIDINYKKLAIGDDEKFVEIIKLILVLFNIFENLKECKVDIYTI